MPWRCPACEIQIRHSDLKTRRGTRYRYHICRLKLMLDESANRLTVAPLPTADDNKDRKKTKNVIRRP